jgi:hypothetical protein
MSPVPESDSIVIEVVDEDTVRVPSTSSSSSLSDPSPSQPSLSPAAVQAVPEATCTAADVVPSPEAVETRSESESTPVLTSTAPPLVNDSEFSFFDGDSPSSSTSTTATAKPGKAKKKKETFIRRAERWLNKRLVAIHLREPGKASTQPTEKN